MKRLIAILVIFAVMMGFAVGEIVYVDRFYSEQYRLLKNVERCFDLDPENIDNEYSVRAFKEADEHWQNKKQFTMMLGNHNTTKFLDEKMVSIKELIRMNQQYDAYVNLNVALNYIDEIKDDLIPKLHNLL